MARYLVTYMDSGGAARTERLEASAASELKARLENEGHVGVVLHDDDLTAKIKDTHPALRNLVSAQRELEQQVAPRVRSAAWWRSWSIVFGILGVAIFVDGVRPPWSFWSLVDVLIGAAVCYGAAASWALVVFGRIRHAKTWKRLDEMERLLRSMRAANRVVRLQILRNELIVNEAILMSARGDTAAAVQHLEAQREVTGWDESTFLVRLSEIHEVAHDHRSALECLRKAYELSAPDSTHHIEYAFGLAILGQDPEEAERVLDSRQPAAVTPPARIFIGWARAQIELRRREYQQAADMFRGVLSDLEPIYQPAIWEGPKLAIQTGLACALAHLGDPDARALFDEVMPFVLADGNPLIIESCEEALAVMGGK